jgi:glycosyltransferase involved in cell wall biosynthesis
MNDLFDQLIISSPNGGGLFLISNNRSLKLDSIDTAGLSMAGGIFLRGQQPSSLWICYEETYEVGNETVTFDDIHDVLCYGKNIYLVGTLKNEIIKLDQNGKEVKRWLFDGDDDSYHINCLGIWDKRIIFSAFGEFHETREYKGKTERAGYVQDLMSGKRLIGNLSQPHSLVPYGKNLLIANSEEMELREYAPSGDLIRAQKLDGYTRGICVSGDVIYVGLSRSRNIDDCGVETATLIALDNKSWKEMGRLLLPVKEIYSVLSIADTHELLSTIANVASHSSSKYDDQITGLDLTVTERNREIAFLNQTVIERNDQVEILSHTLSERDGQLETLNQSLLERDSQITNLSQDNKSRDDLIQRLDAELAHLREELTASQRAVKEHESKVDQLQAEIKERDEYVQRLESDSAGLQEQCTALQVTITERNAAVAHLQGSIKEKNEHIQQKDAELAGLRKEFTASQQAVKEHESKISHLETRIKEKDEHIHQLNADVGRLRDEAGSLRTHVENYRLERESIFDSTSWKLTAPLRWVSVNARNFKRNIGATRYFFSRQYRLIKKSGLFDMSYYLDQNPDVANSKMNPLAHYLKYGWKEGRSPSQNFETSNYWKQNPEISERKIDPLSEYLNDCKKEGKDPNTIFKSIVNNPYGSNLLKSDTIPHIDLNNKNGNKLNVAIVTSIIIYVSSLRDLQHECVEFIQNTTKQFYPEIIVVTNEGTDDDINAAKDYQGIKIINVREACHFHCLLEASKTAEGKYCVFLNNISVVMDGWLDHLISVLEANNLVGMIGSKVINSDGKIEDVGGIVWSNGKIFQHGYLEDPDLPEYNYLKEVDYISGNSFIIRKELLSNIGGFDCMFSKDIFQYIDLAFKIRKRGFKVLYHPKSVVVITDKENSNSDRTKNININTHNSDEYKLKKKWSKVLKSYHLEEGSDIYLARDRSQRKKKILVVDHYTPEFDMDAGSLRMFNLLKIMSELDYKVIFWPENRAYKERYTCALQRIGVEVIYGAIDFEKYLKMNGEHIEVILLSRPHIAINFIDAAKTLTNAKIIYDTVDLVFLREERKAKLEGKKLGNKIKTAELLLANKADKVLVVSPVEKEILEKQGLKGKVSVISTVHSLELSNNSFENRAGLMFIGGFRHLPNEDGIVWFIQSIFPLINKSLPGIHLYIVGSHPTDKVKSLASPNVTVTGYVEDVSFYFEKSRVFVSPLRYGAGVKGKIGQSMAYGLPVVTTSIGAEGIGVTDDYNILIADSESQFKEKVVKVYQDPKLWNTLSLNARTLIKQKYTPNAIKKELSKVLRDTLTLKPY